MLDHTDSISRSITFISTVTFISFGQLLGSNDLLSSFSYIPSMLLQEIYKAASLSNKIKVTNVGYVLTHNSKA